MPLDKNFLLKVAGEDLHVVPGIGHLVLVNQSLQRLEHQPVLFAHLLARGEVRFDVLGLELTAAVACELGH